MASRRPRLILSLLSLTLLFPALAACSEEAGPAPVLDAFLAGWPKGTFENVNFVKASGERLDPAAVGTELRSLEGTLAQTPPAVAKKSDPVVSAELATTEVVVKQPLPNGTTWEYTTTVRMSKAKDAWRVIWEPAVVHPKLTFGDALAVRRIAPVRAGVLDGAGEAIVKPRPVVVVGVEPQRVKDLDQLVKDLDEVLKGGKVDASTADLAARVKAAKPDALVEVVTLRREVYDPIRDRLRALEGMRFREEQWLLAPTRTFARALLGTVGPVTKEIMDAKPGVYAVGDQAGLGGMQKQYEDLLRGTAGMKVVVTRKAADGTTQDEALYTLEAKNGTPLKTTLDPAAQVAAEKALSTVKQRSAMVAIRISDGRIIAAANSGDENLAFNAQVPPGSTFKTVTAYALLEAGKVTPTTIVACPKFITVDGRQFKNSHFLELGNVQFHVDYAKSCNTAFASLAPQLGPDGLATAAGTLGLGQAWDLGTPAFSGKVSANGSATEQAAAAFGQGQTIVSPVAMAGVAAAVARGQWKQPILLTEPAPVKPAADGPQLKDTTLAALRSMMREVVTDGTATLLKDVPGGPVQGKTGTAEYDDNPDHSHAWFIGWQGDIAFAVFVEAGYRPSDTAVPVTEAFLRGLR
ncbi:penicillin-binding transpeptidase domain-containing protein [Catellatospora sp. KI3]|uniref:penicillin-binding transpeptidase domain-containing protein n=1 Tax=Catellatospora sp. KI3 TaxID=3041620 RepID=UPI0024826B1A|nr:penicillin-binding transpeptidase domain-containing protein [Catellatospora sp. KI3]MDI1459626.1 penicillin-binding transpeptidase domain-containing protein [Catellatospora sp. KI3]